MLSLKEAYENDAVLKLFPKPDYSHISENIKVNDAIWIDFKNIYIDDEEGNLARSDGQDPSHIEDLKMSFGAGVILNEEIGAVKFRGNEYPQPWVLKYGYGRTLAQIELGIKGWAFNPIEGTDTEIEDVQSFENEPKAPKSTNQERDIIRIKSRQVKQGTLSNKEDFIYANLKKTYPRRKKESLDRIAAGIFEDNNTPVKYAYYTDSKINLWRDNHCADWFAIGGNWDRNRQMFGYTSKIGGLYRTFHRARVKYAEGEFISYVHAFTGQVSKGSTLEQQRESITKEYISLRVTDALTYGVNVKFVSLVGFFPQAYGVDKWSEFVEVDQDRIEREVLKAIKGAKEVKTAIELSNEEATSIAIAVDSV